MKVVTTNLLNRFWKNGVKPIKDALTGKVDSSKIVNSLLATEAGFALDARQGKVLNDKVTELIGKTYADGHVFVDFGSLPNATSKNVPIAGLPSDVKHIWVEAGWAKNSNGSTQYTLPYSDTDSVTNNIRVVLTGRNVGVVTKSNWTGYPAYFIIGYKL